MGHRLNDFYGNDPLVSLLLIQRPSQDKQIILEKIKESSPVNEVIT
jgi:hypothetical protein